MELTYLESHLAVNALAREWVRLGLRRGSVAACLFEESPASILAVLALIRIGAVFAPLQTPQPVSALRKQVGRLKTKFLAYNESDDGLVKAKEFSGFNKISINIRRLIKELASGSQDDPTKMARSISAWNLGQPFSFLFTSGSSGVPKIAGHRLGNFWASALASNERIPFGPKDTWLLRLPLFHVGGLSILFRALRGGGTILFPSSRGKIEESLIDATHVSLVSTQFRRIAESRSGLQRLSGLKAVLLGGGPMPNEILRKVRSAKLKIYTSYGLTEMSSQAATSPFRNEQGWLAPLPGVQIKVLKNGELAVKGPSLFSGYWENRKWKKPFDRNGYFYTGDLGEKNAGGEVRVLGRGDGLIISGGENIQPEEIENAILKIFPVQDVMVVGIPNKLYGSRPVAFIQWKARALSEANIRSRLKKILPGFKIPDHFWDWPRDKENFKSGMKWSRPAFAKRAIEKLQTLSSPR